MNNLIISANKTKMGNFRSLLALLYIAIMVLISNEAISQAIALDDALEMQKLMQQQQISSEEGEKIQDTSDLVVPKDSKDTRTNDLNVPTESRSKPTDLSIEPQVKSLNLPLKKFGYDLFSDAPTTFAPATDIPIPADYVIGPGDNINIILFGKENREITQQVTREGSIFLPGIGPVSIAGLSFDQMKKIITQRIENEMIGIQSSITLGELKSIQIFVLGDAYQPGSYLISSLATLTNALFASGGVKENGSLRDIQLKRNGKIIVHFDLYNLLLNGDTSKDQRLKSGDVIFIPPLQKTAGISGEVSRPGIYEVLESETFEDLISYSGGFLPTAHLPSAEVERISTDGLTILETDLSDNSIASLSIENGDILHLYPILNSMENSVLLSGYVKRPGFYGYKEGLRISDIFESNKDLLPYSDRQYLLIKRENPFTAEVNVLQVNLNEVFENKTSKNDPLLLERDEIFVFSNKAHAISTDRRPDEFAETLQERILQVKDQKGVVVWEKPTSREEQQDVLLEAHLMFPNINKQDYDLTVEIRQLDLGNRIALLKSLIAQLKAQAGPGLAPLVVKITGSVNYAGDYPLTDGMTLDDSIIAVGGLQSGTYVQEVEITSRTMVNDEFITTRSTISLTDKESLQYKLSPGDSIFFKQIDNALITASIMGEVRFPGNYILRDSETLLELLERAGGLKDDAFIGGAMMQRESIKEMEEKRLAEAAEVLEAEIAFQESQVGTLGSVSSTGALDRLRSDVVSTEALGRLVIDLEGILNELDKDLLLEDRDVLFIPKQSQTVAVLGEVYVPSSHLFDANKSIQDYILLSGNVTKNANEEDIYVIKANGSINVRNQKSNFFKNSNFQKEIEAGDTIIVPIETEAISGMKAASDITQIIYQMAVATAAVTSF